MGDGFYRSKDPTGSKQCSAHFDSALDGSNTPRRNSTICSFPRALTSRITGVKRSQTTKWPVDLSRSMSLCISRARPRDFCDILDTVVNRHTRHTVYATSFAQLPTKSQSKSFSLLKVEDRI